MVRSAVVWIGCDKQGRPLIGTSPDGIACVVAATAEVQKIGIDVEQWRTVRGAELGEMVPTGVAIFLNPVGGAPFLLASKPT